MLNDASGFHKIYLATGYTDLRRGMEGLANIIRFRFHRKRTIAGTYCMKKCKCQKNSNGY